VTNIPIREAKASLEKEARDKARAKAAEAEQKQVEREQAETGKKPSKRVAEVPNPETALPDSKAQRNFTDPESRIMPDGANKGSFIQAYNAQIAVDAKAQVIVAARLTQSANDARQLVPMAETIIANVGKLAETTTADAGYFSAEAVEHSSLQGTNLLVPPSRQKHGAEPAPGSTEITASAAERMRKAIVEPVFRANEGVPRFAARHPARIRRCERRVPAHGAWPQPAEAVSLPAPPAARARLSPHPLAPRGGGLRRVRCRRGYFGYPPETGGMSATVSPSASV
jgi:hypothetical protein